MSGFEPKSPCPISFNPVNPWRPIRVINVTLFHDSCGTVRYTFTIFLLLLSRRVYVCCCCLKQKQNTFNLLLQRFQQKRCLRNNPFKPQKATMNVNVPSNRQNAKKMEGFDARPAWDMKNSRMSSLPTFVTFPSAVMDSGPSLDLISARVLARTSPPSSLS